MEKPHSDRVVRSGRYQFGVQLVIYLWCRCLPRPRTVRGKTDITVTPAGSAHPAGDGCLIYAE